MPPTSKTAPHAVSTPGRSATTANHPGPLVTVICAWFIPGAGHFMQGQTRKGAILACVLVAMFAIGLGSSGRLFQFTTSEPLVLFAAVAQWMLGLPRLVAAIGGWGPGVVTAITYESGNTFLITAGLLNILVALDAFDYAVGRKAR